ncbi:MAG: hypothetical protein ACTHNB_12900 [Gaiellaceae bacterium]
MKRLLSIAAGLVIAAAAVTTVIVTGGVATSSAKAASPVNGLSAYVVPSKRQPLPACSQPDFSDCTARNSVQWYIHVANSNQVLNVSSPSPLSFGTRPELPNAFVVNSVDEREVVSGVQIGQDTLVPPPNLTRRFRSAGRFISTVTCGDPVTVPCNTVISPAVLPGEDVAVFVEGWFHTTDPSDPNGLLVVTFTVHGTLNGTPVDLTASAPPIQETG